MTRRFRRTQRPRRGEWRASARCNPSRPDPRGRARWCGAALEERLPPGARPLAQGTRGAAAERRSTRPEVAFEGVKTRTRKHSSVRLLASPLRGPRCLRAFVVRVRFDARRAPRSHRGARSSHDYSGFTSCLEEPDRVGRGAWGGVAGRRRVAGAWVERACGARSCRGAVFFLIARDGEGAARIDVRVL